MVRANDKVTTFYRRGAMQASPPPVPTAPAPTRVANQLLQGLCLFYYIACRAQPLQQLLALRSITCFQCERFFTLHDGQTAGDALVAYIDNINAHLSNDG